MHGGGVWCQAGPGPWGATDGTIRPTFSVTNLESEPAAQRTAGCWAARPCFPLSPSVGCPKLRGAAPSQACQTAAMQRLGGSQRWPSTTSGIFSRRGGPRRCEKKMCADPSECSSIPSRLFPQAHRWRYVFGRDETILDSCTDPETLPAWLHPGRTWRWVHPDHFKKDGLSWGLETGTRTSGISGGRPPHFLRTGRPLEQPLLFIAGGEESGGADVPQVPSKNPWPRRRMPPTLLALKQFCFAGVGHCGAEQEAPESVKPSSSWMF